MDHTPKSQWEYIYQTIPINQIPWETGQPSPDLVDLFKKKFIRKGTKVLDVGCGLGTQTRFMAKKGAMVTGIDIAQTAVKRAREQLLKDKEFRSQEGDGHPANFVVGDVCKMPFPNASFEFVYDRGCYHHLNSKQREEYGREVARILSPNGILHMLIFAGTIIPQEVIEFFLSNFRSLGAFEDTVVDHTNNQEITIHLVRFQKIG